MPQMNFDDIPDFELVEDGEYNCELVKAEEGVAGSGFEKIDTQWKVVEEGAYEGRVLFDTFSWHPRALTFTKRKLIAIGVHPDKKGEVTADMFPIGEVFVLRVGTQQSKEINPETGEPYDPRNTVKGYRPSDLSVAQLAK